MSTTTCGKELLQMQKNLDQALECVNVTLARTGVMSRELDAVTTKFVDLRSSVQQRVCFDNKHMVCIETDGVNVTQERDTNAAKTEQILLEV